MNTPSVFIIGAGPAGLSAAHELIQNGVEPIVLETRNQTGGIAGTRMFNGYRFDIGGHRFFTKNDRVKRLWSEVMGDDFLCVERLSRIYYRGLLFNYPLRPINAIGNLGAKESFFIGLSYLFARLKHRGDESSFEQWVCNRFGRRLYQLFFKSYTEKVWGMPCTEIHAEWAAQRIKGLSLLTAVTHACNGDHQTESLIDRFAYPPLGAGMIWQRLADRIESRGGRIIKNARAVRLLHHDNHVEKLVYRKNDREVTVPVSSVLSSAPITHLVDMLHPHAPPHILKARSQLKHRAFIIVLLVLDNPSLFPDQWIYVHQPDVRVGRIQNFKNWSAAMVPDGRFSGIGMEYFCNVGDSLWNMSDDALCALAARELEKLDLASTDEVRLSHVERQSHAYPIYHRDYHTPLSKVKQHVAAFDNLLTMGRNGTHRYNNMDHAMESGFLAARTLLGHRCDIWGVNEAREYLETSPRDGEVDIESVARVSRAGQNHFIVAG